MEKLIYLDNAATTLRKPPGVAEAVAQAILTAGNAARGAHGASMQASRTVYETRQKLARLLGCPRPDHVVFTSNSTTALNICDWGSAEVSDMLYADYGIATRPVTTAGTRMSCVSCGISGHKSLSRHSSSASPVYRARNRS